MLPEVDATCVYGNLYQGSRPPLGTVLRRLGFDVLVLCAQEFQPDEGRFPGLQVIHVPFDDDPTTLPDRSVLRGVVEAGQHVANALSEDKKVLVTCWMGLNRSGLVSALALHLLLDLPGREIVRMIRSKRHGALSNPIFAELVHRLGQ